MGGETQKVAKWTSNILGSAQYYRNPSSLMDVLQFGRKKGLHYTNPSVLMGSSAIVRVSKPFFGIAYSYWTFLENAASRT